MVSPKIFPNCYSLIFTTAVSLALIFGLCFRISAEEPTVQNSEPETQVFEQESTVSEQEATDSEQEITVSEQEAPVSEQEIQISEQESQVSEQETTVSEQEAPISEQETTIPEQESQVSEQEKEAPSAFVKIAQNSDGVKTALQTSVVRYESEDGTWTVTLIGAVHLGEEAYYRALNEEFKKYDAVLYEFVAPEGSRPQKASDSNSLIGETQKAISKLLGLKFQVGSIDYSPENMYHADMTPEEFQKAMNARNDSFLAIYTRILIYSFTHGGNDSSSDDADLLLGLLSSNRKYTLRSFMADELSNLEETIQPIEGKDGSAIIKDRNEKVFQVLAKQRETGKRNLAIFYGAAHLPDMAKTLETRFHLKQKTITWLTAWKLVPDAPSKK